jgi:hypothetical protein
MQPIVILRAGRCSPVSGIGGKIELSCYYLRNEKIVFTFYFDVPDIEFGEGSLKGFYEESTAEG